MADLLGALPDHLKERARPLNEGGISKSGRFVLYWMRTAVRAHENPALDVAARFSQKIQVPLLVYHALSERYQYASDRLHTFVLQGARDVQEQFCDRQIPYAFHLERTGHRGPHLITLCKQSAIVITEDMPVDPVATWTRRLSEHADCAMVAVDTACILPMRLVGKAHTRAFKFRDATAELRQSRIQVDPSDCEPVLSDSVLETLPFQPIDLRMANLAELVADCQIDHTIGPVPHTVGGSRAGYERWDRFRAHGLRAYHRRRNDALDDGVSRMSPYLHFGMVAPQRIARQALEMDGPGAEKFLDELLIWRELAYAFCFHRRQHDCVDAIPDWARKTLAEHASDSRPMLPSWETLARGATGDRLWDAAQKSLLIQGELHNNVRMTWGKAFLPWTANAEQALRQMIDLNHRYALDGRDPASYGGMLWCLGQFDRPFTPPQPILGTVRSRPTADHAKRLDAVTYMDKTTQPYAEPMPSVAVIGAGLAGLMCARTLSDHRFQVTVFEKSRGFGGRMATRRHDQWRFDHGAQYFTVRDDRFQRYVDSWQHDGLVQPWNAKVAVIGRSAEVEFDEGPVRFVATPGMNAIGKHLSDGIDVQLNTRIGRLHWSDPHWELVRDDGESLGEFDNVVVAVPAGQAAELLSDCPAVQQQAASCTMDPCWAGMFVLPERLPVEYDAAFVHDSPLSWIARNSSKPAREATHETWVVHAGADWTHQRDGAPREQVARELLVELGQALGDTVPKPTYQTAHFWRYALPPTPLPASHLFEPSQRLVVCGDWCGGPRVEGAFLSGCAAAGRLMGYWNDLWASLPE